MSIITHWMYQRSAEGVKISWLHSVYLQHLLFLILLQLGLARTVIVIAFHLKADDLGVELNYASSGQSQASRW